MRIGTFGNFNAFRFMTDKELLDEIALGNKQAFNLFYEKYAPVLTRFALKFTKSEDLSNEISQLFWIRLWENPMEIKTDEVGNAYRYLSKVFTFRILDVLKEKNTSKETYYESVESVDNRLYDINSDMDKKELYDVINTALNNLPDTFKEVFQRLYIDELSVKETAQQLHLNERTVLYKSKQGLESIRNTIRDWYSSKNGIDAPDISSEFKDLTQNISILLIIKACFYF
jgi:RNA polymerase sigma factor (sigma-70 family)